MPRKEDVLEVFMNKFCTSCGAVLEEGQRFCGNCGKPVQGSGTAVSQPSVRKSTPDNAVGASTPDNAGVAMKFMNLMYQIVRA